MFLQKVIRTAFYDLMGRSKGNDPVQSQYIATTDEIKLFESGKHSGPVMCKEGFKLQIGKDLATPWNEKVIDHVIELVRDRCGVEDLRELRKMIKTCIDGISDKYHAQSKQAADPIGARDIRTEFNRDQRRRNVSQDSTCALPASPYSLAA